MPSGARTSTTGIIGSRNTPTATKVAAATPQRPRPCNRRAASAPIAKYQLVGKQREDPVEGSFQAYASHDDEAWKRLTRTIDVPVWSCPVRCLNSVMRVKSWSFG